MSKTAVYSHTEPVYETDPEDTRRRRQVGSREITSNGDVANVHKWQSPGEWEAAPRRTRRD